MVARPDPAPGVSVDNQTRPPARIPYEEPRKSTDPLEALLAEEAKRAPSLPVVLFSAGFGLSAAILGFFLAYGVVHLRIELAVGLATLFLCFAIGISGAILSQATGSRAALPNIGLSCGLVVLSLLFLGLCVFVGALVATMLIAVRV